MNHGTGRWCSALDEDEEGVAESVRTLVIVAQGAVLAARTLLRVQSRSDCIL